jgi:hypothetical protein
MRRLPKKLREEARQLFLTGEMTGIAEIGRHLKLRPNTVSEWRKEENWDALRIRIERRAAEELVEKLANERVNLNVQHFKMWSAVLNKAIGCLSRDAVHASEIRDLDRAAAIIEKAQRGQRLARGLTADGETEEQIRAQAAAEIRGLIDRFIDAVKTEVADEGVRSRIAQAILARSPSTAEDGHGAPVRV